MLDVPMPLLFAGQLGKDSGPSLPYVLRNIAKKSGSGSDKNVEGCQRNA
jgi:hypothetical protein